MSCEATTWAVDILGVRRPGSRLALVVPWAEYARDDCRDIKGQHPLGFLRSQPSHVPAWAQDAAPVLGPNEQERALAAALDRRVRQWQLRRTEID